jgi:hypothetical protein
MIFLSDPGSDLCIVYSFHFEGFSFIYSVVVISFSISIQEKASNMEVNKQSCVHWADAVFRFPFALSLTGQEQM